MYEFERAVSYESLFMAFEKLRVKNSKTCGVDEVSIKDYNTNLYDNLQMLHYSLISNQYIPYREKVFISKKGRKIYRTFKRGSHNHPVNQHGERHTDAQNKNGQEKNDHQALFANR